MTEKFGLDREIQERLEQKFRVEDEEQMFSWLETLTGKTVERYCCFYFLFFSDLRRNPLMLIVIFCLFVYSY